jgi:hypothetical protein
MTNKEKFMKKYSVVAVTLLVCCGMALTAHAQDAGPVVVTVPFEFIAGGQTLPAGTYTIRKAFAETSSALLISGGGTHGLFVLPAAFDGAAGDKVHLSFEPVGETHLLSAVTTEAGTYTIATGPAVASLSRLAKMKSTDNMKSDTSASGTR